MCARPVSEARWKRLAQLKEQAGSSGRARGGVMIVPRILSPKEWEAAAVPHMAKLRQDAMDDALRDAMNEQVHQ
jgi:hypothetical protein